MYQQTSAFQRANNFFILSISILCAALTSDKIGRISKYLIVSSPSPICSCREGPLTKQSFLSSEEPNKIPVYPQVAGFGSLPPHEIVRTSQYSFPPEPWGNSPSSCYKASLPQHPTVHSWVQPQYSPAYFLFLWVYVTNKLWILFVQSWMCVWPPRGPKLERGSSSMGWTRG